MPDPLLISSADESEYVEFLEAGVAAKGEFHCSGCGYGVTIYSELPVCPMCAGGSWERSSWAPFTRATAAP